MKWSSALDNYYWIACTTFFFFLLEAYNRSIYLRYALISWNCVWFYFSFEEFHLLSEWETFRIKNKIEWNKHVNKTFLLNSIAIYYILRMFTNDITSEKTLWNWFAMILHKTKIAFENLEAFDRYHKVSFIRK